MQLSKDTKRFLFLLCAFCIGLVLCVQHVTSIASWFGNVMKILTPFIIGACFAFILNIPMRLFDRLFSHKTKSGKPLLSAPVRKPVSLVMSILFLIALICVFAVIVLPNIVETFSTLASSIMRFVPVAQQWIDDILAWLDNYPDFREIVAPYIPDISQLATTIISFIQRYALSAVTTVLAKATSFFSRVADVVIATVFAMYVLLQKEALARQIKKLIYAFLPRWIGDNVMYIATLARNTFFSYITIQCTEATILGSLCLIGMLIFRFPHALVISVIMIFCALIPIYGAIISCVIGAILVLIESPAKTVWFVLFILVLQQIENNLIYPRVVSTSINLPPMWVMLSVTVGGDLFGIIGMMTAVPTASILYTLMGEIAHLRLQSRHIKVETNDISTTGNS